MKRIAIMLAFIMLIMSFACLTAFAEEDTVTITFRTSDGTRAFLDNALRDVNEIIIVRERGHVIERRDMPRENHPIPANYTHEWDVDPLGVTVNEDTVFTLVITPITATYTVTFHDWNGKAVKSEKVLSGRGCTPPELEDRDGVMVVDWKATDDEINRTTGYHVIFCDADFYPVGALRGDANHNDKLDSGDATLVLRRVVEDPYGRIGAGNYDYNMNGETDAGDATGILRAVLGS